MTPPRALIDAAAVRLRRTPTAPAPRSAGSFLPRPRPTSSANNVRMPPLRRNDRATAVAETVAFQRLTRCDACDALSHALRLGKPRRVAVWRMLRGVARSARARSYARGESVTPSQERFINRDKGLRVTGPVTGVTAGRAWWR